MGKTAFILETSKKAAEFGEPVAIFSLEMPDTELMNRMTCSEILLNTKRLNRKLDDDEYRRFHEGVEKISELPIYIDDTAAISIFEVKRKARRLVMEKGVKMVVIDYLQLMTIQGNHGNREQQVSEISRQLKALAKELNIPVIALSQLSRAVEIRGGTKRPQLSDLRESGSIEQDSDCVIFIYRPEYYQIVEDEEGRSLKGVAELIFAKNRCGDTGTVELKFIKEFTKFKNLEEDGFEEVVETETSTEPPQNWNIITRPAKMNSDQDIPF